MEQHPRPPFKFIGLGIINNTYLKKAAGVADEY